MNTINNILDGLLINATLNEFDSKVKIENLTPFDIIQASANAPIILNKLSEDFIGIESHINSVLGDLDKEYKAIVSNSDNNILSVKNQHRQQILDKETELNNGTYISYILKEHNKSYRNTMDGYNIAKYVSIGVGVLFMFGVGFFAGLLIGGIGFALCQISANSNERKIEGLSNYLRGTMFSSDDRNNLRKISYDLGTEIGIAGRKLESDIEFLRITLGKEYDIFVNKELEDKNQKLQELEQKKATVSLRLLNKSSKDVTSIKAQLLKLVSLLNQVPETFDNNSINWKSENIIKGKETVASNIRIGYENISINLEKIQGQRIEHVEESIDTEYKDSVVQDSIEKEYKIKVVQEYEIDRGYISGYLESTNETQIVLENSFILFYYNKISEYWQFISVLEKIATTGSPLLIITTGVEDKAYKDLVANILVNVVVILAPGFGDRQKEILEDIASLTGGLVHTDESDLFVKNFELSSLGMAEEISIEETITTISGCKGNYADVIERVNLIKSQINRETSDYAKEKLHERLSKLIVNEDLQLISSKEINKGKSPNQAVGSASLEAINYVEIEGNKFTINVPRCIPFLNISNIVFNCKNTNETKEAIRITHNIIGRILISLPASKTKITFIDSLELGGNAAPYTPLLREIYGGMVFTQQNDIENQLSILTRAIENVIQKYLQDKFKDIAEYNFKTKEVPEPYRLLVVYNFPHGFNDTTANKLLNIIKSGPKAGVHTILVNDIKAKLPYGMNWENFNGININEIPIVNSRTENKQFSFDNNLPYNEIVDYINKELPNTNSIKVLFKIPPKSEWWQEKAHKRFSVPIGRHAVEEQNFSLNNEDDNQALLIGKPGSGKSNLLHTIISNSIWKYSPDQLEIYLIDFKGGVEFTIYADKKIPHIRTIAIESEREFGLSVLDGVERELLRREMDFSKTGVQNIEQYHEKFPEIRMPRVLLIVDEFQEFYAEDDNIKQAVDDKFDRIIRKGRAFGINTLFSSQTLSGNSIKKSTKELIDIRIALMCSDLDANQILDDRNPAARDLSRPGEGIYNPENGKIEGNRRFQAFFIETADLIKTIESVVSFANENGNKNRNYKQIIFRGSEKALMEKNDHPLKKIMATSSPKTLRLWVGEPVAIADDVTAVIRKQGGSNLLVAGYDESIGLRVMCSSIISIAAQQQPNTCKFYSFNFYNVDSEFVNIPDELFDSIQQEGKRVNNRQVKEALQAIKDEIEKRLSGSSTNSHNIYLTFFSLQRGRAFRKDGYSMSDEGNLLAHILKEGPDVGVYSLVQVDTMDNLTKNLDDNLLKEFSQRVASQMNPDNSVKLIGNQKAAKLGSNRAWYFDDNENTMIKFKPYELPTFSWVAQLQKPQSTLS